MENNNQISQQLNELTEIVGFIKDNAATKDDLAELESRMATKNDLANLKSELKEDMAKMETRLVTKDYLDRKLSQHTAELGERIYRHDEKDKIFKKEQILIFQKHSIFSQDEIERLKQLV